MARANGKPRGRPPHKNSKAALPMPGDEQVGGWSQAQLIRMDNRFRARLLRAFESGKENRQAAAAMYDANPTTTALSGAQRRAGDHVGRRTNGHAFETNRPVCRDGFA
jgi:hypothetical protein